MTSSRAHAPAPIALATHAILFAAQICFASLPVFGKLALIGPGQLPPAGIVLARMVGAAIAFAVIARLRSPGSLRIARADLPRLLACSALGMAANQELFLHGLARSSATVASVLGATIPVFTALAAVALRYEPVRARRLAGIALACGGAVTLVLVGPRTVGDDPLVGGALLIANSLCYGVFLVVVRPLAARYRPMALLAMLFAAGAPMVAPLGIHAWANAAPIGSADIAYLAFLIAVPTVGAYGLVQIALARAESSLVASYVYLQPLFATLGAVLALGERPTLAIAGCGVIILAGVWISTRAK